MYNLDDIQLAKVQFKDIEKLRIERNKYFVRSKMINQKIISKKQQLKWFKLTSKMNTSYYFIINFKGLTIGAGSIKDIDIVNSLCTWGFYIFKKYNGIFGLLAEIKILDEIFMKRKIRKIYGYTISHNKQILNLHKICGFEIEGILKKQLIINKKKIDIIVTALFKENWIKNKKKIVKKFKL